MMDDLPDRVWVIFDADSPAPIDVVRDREEGDTLPDERAVEFVRADLSRKESHGG